MGEVAQRRVLVHREAQVWLVSADGIGGTHVFLVPGFARQGGPQRETGCFLIDWVNKSDSIKRDRERGREREREREAVSNVHRGRLHLCDII